MIQDLTKNEKKNQFFENLVQISLQLWLGCMDPSNSLRSILYLPLRCSIFYFFKNSSRKNWKILSENEEDRTPQGLIGAAHQKNILPFGHKITIWSPFAEIFSK